MDITPFFILITALFLGLRHGIDLDHIAAITDITTQSKDRKAAFFLGTTYALGHGLVIVLLGVLVVSIGIRLPDWIDQIMKPVVGLSLIFLGLYLGFSILRQGKNMKLKSRWMVLFLLLKKIYDKFESKIIHNHDHSHFINSRNMSLKISFLVGVMHGLSAETPTQLLLFTAASRVGGQILGSLLVFVFVAGLIISNSLITIFSILSIAKVRENSNIYLFLAGVTAIFSLIVGLLFLIGKDTILPAIF